MTTMIKEPEEPRVTCVQCGVGKPVGDALFNELAEHYVCGDVCFNEWADDNFDVVTAEYRRNNIHGE